MHKKDNQIIAMISYSVGQVGQLLLIVICYTTIYDAMRQRSHSHHSYLDLDRERDLDLESPFLDRLLLLLRLRLRLLLRESRVTGDPRFDPRGDLETLRSTSLMATYDDLKAGGRIEAKLIHN